MDDVHQTGAVAEALEIDQKNVDGAARGSHHMATNDGATGGPRVVECGIPLYDDERREDTTGTAGEPQPEPGAATEEHAELARRLSRDVGPARPGSVARQRGRTVAPSLSGGKKPRVADTGTRAGNGRRASTASLGSQAGLGVFGAGMSDTEAPLTTEETVSNGSTAAGSPSWTRQPEHVVDVDAQVGALSSSRDGDAAAHVALDMSAARGDRGEVHRGLRRRQTIGSDVRALQGVQRALKLRLARGQSMKANRAGNRARTRRHAYDAMGEQDDSEEENELRWRQFSAEFNPPAYRRSSEELHRIGTGRRRRQSTTSAPTEDTQAAVGRAAVATGATVKESTV